MISLFQWFLHVTGSDNTSGVFYGFWSGFGSDIGELAVIGGLVAMYKKHNCHAPGCWRIGKHTLEGTPYVVCKLHHPDIPERLTLAHMHDAYHRAQGDCND